MVTHRFTVELEEALRADQAPIRRDGVATLARIMRQEGPPSDRALAALWLYHLANHDPDEQVRAMAAVPIRLTSVWSEGLEDKLHAPEYEVRLDALYSLRSIVDYGADLHATAAYEWLDTLADHDPHPLVRAKAAEIAGKPDTQAPPPRSSTPFLKRTASFGATQHDMLTVLIAYAGIGILFLIFVFGETLFGMGIIGVYPMGLGGLYCLFARSGIRARKLTMQMGRPSRMVTFYGSAAYTMSIISQVQGVLLISIGLAILLTWSEITGFILLLAAGFVFGGGVLAVTIAALLIRWKQSKISKMKQSSGQAYRYRSDHLQAESIFRNSKSRLANDV